jgi:hypothetical protein
MASKNGKKTPQEPLDALEDPAVPEWVKAEIRHIRKVTEPAMTDPAAARKLLVEAGIVDPKGRLMPQYRH